MNVFLFVYLYHACTSWLAASAWSSPCGLGNNDWPIALRMINFVVVISIGGYVSGAMLGFSLFRKQREKTIKSIALAPVRLLAIRIQDRNNSLYFQLSAI